MAQRPSIDNRISALVKLRGGGLTPETIAALKDGLKDKTNLVVAKAASVVRDLNALDLVPEMVEAFERLISHSSSDRGCDKGCHAMTAIAQTLQVFGATETNVYLRGIRHVQPEPAYGGAVDAAVKLRCECAYGLVRIGHRDAIWELAGLLADPDKECRLAAVKAIGHSEADAGMALLKFKILCGDGDNDVAAECLGALPQIDAVKSIQFLGSFLESTDEQMGEAAALALASTRRPEAFELLRAQWNARIDLRSRDMLALAIATLRSEAAISFLLAQLSTANAGTATVVMRALALNRRDDALRARVEEAVAARNEPEIAAAFEKEFA